jgi:hypothetical protein
MNGRDDMVSLAWRRNLPVLVAEAQSIGALAVIRSLGRAGYEVYGASADARALGLRSRLATKGLAAPPYEDPSYLAWLRQTIHDLGIRAIVPSEGFLHRIRPAFDEFAPLIPVKSELEKVYAALSKHDVYGAFSCSSLEKRLPPSRAICDDETVPSEEECVSLGYPVFAKVDQIHAKDDGGNAVKQFPDYASLQTGLQKLLLKYSKVLLQGYVPGTGVGVFLLRWDGNELAHFMHRRIHEVPHTGGASSFREAWSHDGILNDARQRLDHLDWQGVAMLEYRWDPSSGDYWLIEVNARFWGSLHLALFAGVDFPCLLLDAFFGHPRCVRAYDRSVACRLTFPREVEYVLSCVRDRQLSVRNRLWPIAEFFLLGIRPGVYSDLWFPGDRLLYFSALWQTVRKFSKRT